MERSNVLIEDRNLHIKGSLRDIDMEV
jgi:hypothetical protein